MGEIGPCHVVTSSDVAIYDQMVAIDESSVPVVVGEQLCENELLNGLLVHSAGNYATILEQMVAGSTSAFVAMMNDQAALLGLRATHYADATGYSAQSVSTAADQARLAVLLMRSALVRSIVIQSSVTLPVAGSVASYTPLVGFDNVIGVKSGRTSLAGGCDVMAMTFRDGPFTRVVYSVVLGQRGGDLLGPAGSAALALAQSAISEQRHYTFEKTQPLGAISWGNVRVKFAVTRRRVVRWWAVQRHPEISMHVDSFTTKIHRGEVVGYVEVRATYRKRFALRALRTASPPSLLQRLR
ncbi:MAG: D-alanyl-D-alanine carboxypeptidase family protein [Acidimicrobiales bacterium]